MPAPLPQLAGSTQHTPSTAAAQAVWLWAGRLQALPSGHAVEVMPPQAMARLPSQAPAPLTAMLRPPAMLPFQYVRPLHPHTGAYASAPPARVTQTPLVHPVARHTCPAGHGAPPAVHATEPPVVEPVVLPAVEPVVLPAVAPPVAEPVVAPLVVPAVVPAVLPPVEAPPSAPSSKRSLGRAPWQAMPSTTAAEGRAARTRQWRAA